MTQKGENDMSFGTALDKYLSEYPHYETIYIYHDKDTTDPRIIITSAVDSYDYTDVFSEAIDLWEQIETQKKEAEKLRLQVSARKRELKSVENAIKKLVKYHHDSDTQH